MIYAIIYFGMGLGFVAGAFVHECWRHRVIPDASDLLNLEGWILLLGTAALWPIAIASEIRTALRSRSTPKRSNAPR